MRSREKVVEETGGSAPVLVIQPNSGFRLLPLRDLWEYRELLYFLIWRDVKVRYKQTVLGAAWAVLQPFLLMVVFALFLGKLAGVPSDGLPYPLFAFAALVPWTLFASSLAGASNSLVGSSNLITKVYFPRLILPIAAAGSFLLDFAIAFGLLVAMMVFYGVYPSVALAWLPLLTIFAVVTALAVGIWLAALNVRYRDVRYVVPFLTQIWLFATPVAYPSSIIPTSWQPLLGINPMAGVVEGFRWAMLGTGKAPGVIVWVSAAVTLFLLLSGLVYFHQTEQTFADVI